MSAIDLGYPHSQHDNQRIRDVVTGGVDFSSLFIALNGEHYDSLAAARQAGAPTMNIGLFINNVISFLIVRSE